MAALTKTNVRIIRQWREGDLTSKGRLAKRVEVHGGTWGGATNTMPASAFGLRVIEEVSPVGYGSDADTAIALVPIADGSAIRAFTALNNSTSSADVADIPATPGGLYFVVKGY